MRRYDVVVLGGGPAGASAAFFLARSGLEVSIVERAAFPRRKVCGEFVSATTFPTLDAMGVGEVLRAAGGPPTRRVGAYFGRWVVTAPMPAARSEGWGRALARTVLDPALLEAARGQGAEVLQPCRAVGLERTDAGRVVTLDSGERLETRIVVAAHGAWETSALPTQPARAHGPSDLLAFKAFLRGATFAEGLMILTAFPGGYGGMVHRDADTVGLSLCVRRDVLERARRPGETAWEGLLRHIRATNRGVAEATEGATPELPPRAAGPLNPGIRGGYAGGVFRVGNAAGEAHPAIAEGISMAVQSGRLLAQSLTPETIERPDEAGRRYAAAWRAQFGGRVRAADALARLCMGSGADAVAPLLAAFPPLVTAAASLTGKTRALRVEAGGPVGRREAFGP